MNPIDEDKLFAPILAAMENGEIQTANNLRLALEVIAEEANISTLKVLEFYRAWLLTHKLDLVTTYGAVSLEKIS